MAGKRNNKGPWKHETQAKRRAHAEARQAEYDKLTPQQKLHRLDVAGLRALKERAKIKKLIAQGN